MPGGQYKLLILIVGHFVPIDREGVEIDGSLRLFVKSTACCPANEWPRWNRDHFLFNRMFIRRGFCLGGNSVIRWRSLFERRHRRSAENAHDGERSEGENNEQEGDLEFRFKHDNIYEAGERSEARCEGNMGV